MTVKTLYCLVGGRVHGVGFRWFVMQKALELQIYGWVQNTHDGKVEIEAEGNATDLETFTDLIRIGPSRARIHTFSVSEITPARNYSNFIIR